MDRHGQTWTERDGASHPTERPSDGGLSSKDGSPAQATPHVLHARNAHECSLVRLFGLPGDNVFRYMSPSVVCNSRACWTSTYRGKYSNVKYSTCRALVHHLAPAAFPCQPSPSPCVHISFSSSTSALHICKSVGKVTSAAFLFVWMSSFDRPDLYLPCASSSLLLFPFLPAFVPLQAS